MPQRLDYASAPRTDRANVLASRISRVASTPLPKWIVVPILTFALAGVTWLCVIMIGATIGSRSPDAKLKAAGTQLSTIRNGLYVFEQHVGRIPTADEGIAALFEEPTTASGWKGPYMQGGMLPPDPWGYEYVYVPDDDGSYRLLSVGPDGKEGTEDDVDSSGSRAGRGR